jgi:hypothetical protein
MQSAPFDLFLLLIYSQTPDKRMWLVAQKDLLSAGSVACRNPIVQYPDRLSRERPFADWGRPLIGGSLIGYLTVYLQRPQILTVCCRGRGLLGQAKGGNPQEKTVSHPGQPSAGGTPIPRAGRGGIPHGRCSPTPRRRCKSRPASAGCRGNPWGGGNLCQSGYPHG